MDQATFITIILGGSSLVISIIIWVASTQAAKVSAESSSPAAVLLKVDADAYDRAKSIYESAISQLESEVRRLQTQLSEQAIRIDTQNRSFQLEATRLNA